MAGTVISLPYQLLQVKDMVHNMKVAAQDLYATLWLGDEQVPSIFALADKLMQAPAEVDEWKESAVHS